MIIKENQLFSQFDRMQNNYQPILLYGPNEENEKQKWKKKWKKWRKWKKSEENEENEKIYLKH